jgi:diguanylate cyclase (GGDEF)-like protein
VNSDHLVETARHVLAGHKVWAIGVLRGNELVGTISVENLIGATDSDLVRNVMNPVGETVDFSLSVRDAAVIVTNSGREFVAATEFGQFRGILTASMLLADMARTWDPLTELPWSDRLREWGIEQLKDGHEISILFIDLDDFGQYNKKFGHIIGDKVLQAVAHRLREAVNDETDVLVRYGGDEFAIGTTLLRDNAESLSRHVWDAIHGLVIMETDQAISASIGVFGGRRTHERENVHYAATLDNLINVASRRCTEAKLQSSMRVKTNSEITAEATHEAIVEERENVESSEPIGSDTSRSVAELISLPVVSEVSVDENSDRGVSMVTLMVEGEIVRGYHARASGVSAMESVATATANAINRIRQDLRYRIGDVSKQQTDGHDDRVLVRGWAWQNGTEIPVMAEAKSTEGNAMAAADATVAAVARILSFPRAYFSV